MKRKNRLHISMLMISLAGLYLAACGSSKPTAEPATALPTDVPATLPVAAPTDIPTVTPTIESESAPIDWFSFELTDVRTDETFTINDFAGKVVLVETMAQWCPVCFDQENEVIRLHELLGNPEDLISVSLDIDLNEKATTLKNYAQGAGFDWYFAVAPQAVGRTLSDLYGIQYLSPPAAPMLLIDRQGNVIKLPVGPKKAETLQTTIEPYLAQ